MGGGGGGSGGGGRRRNAFGGGVGFSPIDNLSTGTLGDRAGGIVSPPPVNAFAGGGLPDPNTGLTPARSAFEGIRSAGGFGQAPDPNTGLTPGRSAFENIRAAGGFGSDPVAPAAPAVPAGINRGLFEGIREAGGFGGAPQAGIQSLGAGADPNTGLTGMRALFERLRNRGQFG